MGPSRLPSSAEYPGRLSWHRRRAPCGPLWCPCGVPVVSPVVPSERWVVPHSRGFGLEEEEQACFAMYF